MILSILNKAKLLDDVKVKEKVCEVWSTLIKSSGYELKAAYTSSLRPHTLVA